MILLLVLHTSNMKAFWFIFLSSQVCMTAHHGMSVETAATSLGIRFGRAKALPLLEITIEQQCSARRTREASILVQASGAYGLQPQTLTKGS